MQAAVVHGEAREVVVGNHRLAGVRVGVWALAACGSAPAWAASGAAALEASEGRLLALGLGVVVALALLRRRMGAETN
jgi:hypothetical protein